MHYQARDDADRVEEHHFDDGAVVRATWYDLADPAGGDDPEAFIIDYTSGPGGTVIAPHFHHVRQFQVVIAGEGARIGKHSAPPVTFHYTDPDSPYGPIVPGEDGRIVFMTLRPRQANGRYYMPGSRGFMKSRAGRNLVRSLPRRDASTTSNELVELVAREADGLSAFDLCLAGGEEVVVPAAQGSGGQYHLVCAGSILSEGREWPRLSLGWVGPLDPAPTLVAGADGAEVLVLQFPVPTQQEELALAEERQGPRVERGAGPRTAAVEPGR